MGVYEAELTGCERLDALMNADATGAWEVINAGVPGYNTVQEYHYLTETLLAYDPDIVVLHFCMNDADPIELEFEAPTALRKTAAMEAHDLSLRTLINQSYLLRLLKDVILERNPRLRNAAFNYRVQEKAWGVMKDYLARIDETLRERGIPFVVVLYPYRVQLAADPANVLPQQDLASFFKERGTSCIDLQESFRANGGPSLILDDGFHPTADGHALAAEAIRGELRRVLSGDAAR
jgi:lysophospholipase L1-like esterase